MEKSTGQRQKYPSQVKGQELGWGSSVGNGTVLSQMDHRSPQSWNSQFWGREEKESILEQIIVCVGGR